MNDSKLRRVAGTCRGFFNRIAHAWKCHIQYQFITL